MKKIIILFYFFCFFSFVLCAQRFNVGVLGGISSSQVDGDTYAGYDKAGIIAGGFVATPFSSGSQWSASFELTYIQKGSRKVPHPDKGDFTSYLLKMNYAEVPLLVKYDFVTKDSSGRQGGMKFVLEGGLALGALVQSREYDANGLLSGGTPFQKTDCSIIAGLNYFLTKHIVFYIRTEYSLLPVRKGGTSAYYQNWTYKFLKPGYYNNVVLFAIKYQL